MTDTTAPVVVVGGRYLLPCTVTAVTGGLADVRLDDPDTDPEDRLNVLVRSWCLRPDAGIGDGFRVRAVALDRE